jgi:hypothetical protein
MQLQLAHHAVVGKRRAVVVLTPAWAEPHQYAPSPCRAILLAREKCRCFFAANTCTRVWHVRMLRHFCGRSAVLLSPDKEGQR